VNEMAKKGRDLIASAFGVVLFHIFLLAGYKWLLTGNFPIASLTSVAVTIFVWVKVSGKSKWAKYGAIIWSMINIASALHGVYQNKIYVLATIAIAFAYLIVILSFSKSVDAYFNNKVLISLQTQNTQ
jgi:hypothetical protein